MSTKLPQEVQTQKVKTLPDDLKKLAEELLREKFGVEEVRDKSPDSFRGPDEFHEIRFDEVFIEPGMGNRGRRGPVQVSMDPRTRSRLARVHITSRGSALTGIADAMRDLDMENLPNRYRKILIHQERYHEVLREERIMFAPSDRMHQLWGAELVVIPYQYPEMIQQEF